SDPPLRHLWLNFSLALWLWTIAELLWAYKEIFSGVAGLGLADIFWLIAYIFFGIALYAQHKLILRSSEWQGRAVFAAIIAITSGLTILFAYILAHQRQEAFTLPLLVHAFYPAGDLAIGLGALSIVYLFRGGVFNRAWLAMFLFALSDALYAWLFNIGQYQALIEQSIWPQYVIESLYLFAYLAIGLGCFTQWLTLRYGFFYAKKS
ncbi:MAG: hypothetical protein ACK8QZ_05045, partial [Anaerolineales bacterium]